MRILEAYNGLSAKLVENSDYDGIWVSSLTHSASKGLPDTELVPLGRRANLVREIRRMSTKPIFVDVDTGGGHFGYYAKEFKNAGAYALVIEDKAFPKENSLLKNGKHHLEDIDKFCEKIKDGKKSGIKIIARLESLIAKHSIYEALVRAEAYINAGADGIVIHSKSKVSADEVMEFAKHFKKKWDLPLVAIPTTYELPKIHPFDIVIFANQMLRASIKGMQEYLEGGKIIPVEDIFKILDYEDKAKNGL